MLHTFGSLDAQLLTAASSLAETLETAYDITGQLAKYSMIIHNSQVRELCVQTGSSF